MKQEFNFSWKHADFPDEKTNASLARILQSNRLMAMSSVSDGENPHINTAYFAFDGELNIFFMSAPDTKHCRNIAKNKKVALSIYDSTQIFWSDLKGVQIWGECVAVPIAETPHAFLCYITRYPKFSELAAKVTDFIKNKKITVKIYRIKVHKIKLFDEEIFGEEVYVHLDF